MTGPIVAGLVAALGWFVGYFLTKRREEKNRRLEARMRRTERQIEELYGPLFNLMRAVFTVYGVRQQALSRSAGIPPADELAFRRFVQADFFMPLHQRMRDILTRKLHLIEDGKIPDSFIDYMEHSTQQFVQASAPEALNTIAGRIDVRPWPRAFEVDVKGMLNIFMQRYEQCARSLYR